MSSYFCPQQTDVSMLEPEKSTKKSKKRTKVSETTVSRTPNKKGQPRLAFQYNYKVELQLFLLLINRFEKLERLLNTLNSPPRLLSSCFSPAHRRCERRTRGGEPRREEGNRGERRGTEERGGEAAGG